MIKIILSRFKKITYAALLAIMPASLVAQESQNLENSGFLNQVSPVFHEALKKIQKNGDIASIEYADMDGDQEAEIFIVMHPEVNSSSGHDLKKWYVLKNRESDVFFAGSWVGWDIKLVETTTSSNSSIPVSIVWSDGATWYLGENKMVPYGDLTRERSEFIIEQGSLGDEKYFEEAGHGKVNRDFMVRLTLDLTDDIQNDVLISMRGDGYWNEEDASTPYVLVSGDGGLIHHGWSFGHPFIFRMPDGGFQIIESINFSHSLVFFPKGTLP